MVAVSNGNGLDLRAPAVSMQQALRLYQSVADAKAANARADFNEYVEYVMRDERGEVMKQAIHHRIWQVHISYCWQVGVHPAIMAPWSHGKTVQCVVGMATYLLGQNPNLRIKIVCNTGDNAKKRVAAIGSVITQNKHYRQVFPWIRPIGHVKSNKYDRSRWTQNAIYVARSSSSAIDPSIEAAGILSQGMGGRADVLLFDDVVDNVNSLLKEAERDKVIRTFGEGWMSRLEPHGRCIYIGTPWHQADLTHDLYKRKAWCVLRQYVSSDYKQLNQEVYNMPDGYPIPRALGAVSGEVAVAR